MICCYILYKIFGLQILYVVNRDPSNLDSQKYYLVQPTNLQHRVGRHPSMSFVIHGDMLSTMLAHKNIELLSLKIKFWKQWETWTRESFWMIKIKMENKYSPPITACFTNTPDRPTSLAIKRSDVFLVQQFDKLQTIQILSRRRVLSSIINKE